MSDAQLLAALAATARIAGLAGLALTAVACKKDSPAPEVTAEMPAEPAVAEGRVEPAITPPDGVDLAGLKDGEWTDAERAYCTEVTAKELGDTEFGAGMETDGKLAAKTSEEAIACCAGYGTIDVNAARWGCCAVLDDEVEAKFIACTPWGPPAPPAMA